MLFWWCSRWNVSEQKKCLRKNADFDALFDTLNSTKLTPCRQLKTTKKPWNHAVSRLFLMAGAEGFEPSARGFGDRCSTNWAIPLYQRFSDLCVKNVPNNVPNFTEKSLTSIVLQFEGEYPLQIVRLIIAEANAFCQP